LILTLGCAAQQGELLDLLAVARRTAQPPLERVVSDLDEVIEINTSTMKQRRELADPKQRIYDFKGACLTSLRRLDDAEPLTLEAYTLERLRAV